MPAAMTYSSLVTDITNYLQRYDTLVTNQIPQFIALAQQRIPREMKILGFRVEVQGNFDADCQTTGIMQKPVDWRKSIAFYVNAVGSVHSPVLQRDYSYIRTMFPDPSIQDIPRFYGDADWNHWLVQPSPPSALPFKIAYYGTLTLLDDSTQTNWLTQNAPDLLLYATLLEATPFIKADERIPVWSAGFDRAKAALQLQDVEGHLDGQAILYEPQPSSVIPK